MGRAPPSWRRVWPRGCSSASARHYSHDQVVRLLGHLHDRGDGWRDRRLHALTSVVAYTGLRKMEALSLKAEDVSLSTGLLGVVASRRLKTASSAAPVPIASELVEILERWLPCSASEWVFPGAERRGPWTGGGPGQNALDKLQAAGREVELPTVTYHGLRHTLCKLLVGRWGVTRDQARSILRHGDVRTTEDHYLHADDPEILRHLVRNVSFRKTG